MQLQLQTAVVGKNMQPCKLALPCKPSIKNPHASSAEILQYKPDQTTPFIDFYEGQKL